MFSGTHARTQANIIIEDQLPIQDSEIISPSHIRNIVQAVIISIAGSIVHQKSETFINFTDDPKSVLRRIIIQ